MPREGVEARDFTTGARKFRQGDSILLTVFIAASVVQCQTCRFINTTMPLFRRWDQLQVPFSSVLSPQPHRYLSGNSTGWRTCITLFFFSFGFHPPFFGFNTFFLGTIDH